MRMQAELSLTPAYKDVVDDAGKRMLTGDERLSSLTAEYLRASARYSPEHPDIIRLTSRDSFASARQTGMGARTDELMQELTKLQEALRQARQKYSEDHPEVIKLEKSVASVERAFQAAMVQGAGGSRMTLAAPADNARYVDIEDPDRCGRGGFERPNGRNSRCTTASSPNTRTRLFQTPVVERDFKSLSRDYEKRASQICGAHEEADGSKAGAGTRIGQNSERFVSVERSEFADES